MNMNETAQNVKRELVADGTHVVNYLKARLMEVEHSLAMHMSVVTQLHEQLTKAEARIASLTEENEKLREQLEQPKLAIDAKSPEAQQPQQLQQ